MGAFLQSAKCLRNGTCDLLLKRVSGGLTTPIRLEKHHSQQKPRTADSRLSSQPLALPHPQPHCCHPALEIARVNRRANTNSYLSSMIPERLASLIVQLVKNPPAMQEIPVQFLGWKDALEKGKATHSIILAQRIPRTAQSMGSQRVGHN